MDAIITQPESHVVAAPRIDRQRGVLADLLQLCKARLCALVVFTAAVGFLLAAGSRIDWVQFTWMVLGTTLSAFGANAINQCIEIKRDARMLRTRNRPLPSGRLDPRTAWVVAIALAVAGPLTLLFCVNWTTALLSLACILLYTMVYTPMKVRSTANTLVGAVCGAIPPMMGWSAVTGTLEMGALVLGAILFVWQIPHFLALAWMYREDYERGGYCMLPVVDPTGRLTFHAILLYSLALVPVTLLLTLSGAVGLVYASTALLLGIVLIALGIRLQRERTVASARGVFLASVIYLPLLMGVMIADRTRESVTIIVPLEQAPGISLVAVGAAAERP